MKDLIFDLEDNGGGYLQAAAQIANEFLQKGDLTFIPAVVQRLARNTRRRLTADGAMARWWCSPMSLPLLPPRLFPEPSRIRTVA